MDIDRRPAILVVDDREDLLRVCERTLGHEYVFRLAPDARAAAAALAEAPCDAVLLDRDFSRADPARLLGPAPDARDEGLHILRWLRRERPALPVIMVTGWRDLPVALAAADLGADFLAWDDVSADPAVLAARLGRALESGRESREAVLARFRALGLVAESPAFAAAVIALARALPGTAPILLLGDTGTGKDTLAEAAHALGGDPERPFVNVNVAELTASLAESELFGHVSGSFTGAARDTIGKIRAAHGGTLFLNEIGDMPLDLQAKFLTVLERNEVVPVGGVKSCPAKFRLIAASQRHLGHLVETGRFRPDLLHRLAWHVVVLPPLAERAEDLTGLAYAILRRTPAHRRGDVKIIAREALAYLATLPWPGNVRQLAGVIEDACAQARHTLTVADLREAIRRRELLSAPLTPAPPPVDGAPPPPPPPPDLAAAEALAFRGRDYEALTAAYFRHLSRQTGGRMSEVAQQAGVGRTTAYEWRRRFGGESDPESEPTG